MKISTGWAMQMAPNQGGQECDNLCTSSMCLKYNLDLYLVSEKSQGLCVCVLKDCAGVQLGLIFHGFHCFVKSDLKHTYVIEI